MGRRKLNMKFIANEKDRVSTYQKRKKGLTKKAEEFSILCGVETCVIIEGPKLKDSPSKLDIWPSDPAQVMNVINKYKRKPCGVRERKCFNLFDFFAVRQKKLDDEICKLRKANLDARFPTWDDRINYFTVNQIWELLARLDSNLEAAEKKMKMMKGKYQYPNEDSKSRILADPAAQVIQPMSAPKPYDMNAPSYYPLGSSKTLPMQNFRNLNPINNSMTMVSTDGLGFTQVDGESSSSITYSSLSPQAYYDPAAPMLDGNVMFNNPWGAPFCFYGPFLQPVTPFWQSAMPSFPSQFGELYRDIGDDKYGSRSFKRSRI